ncbi:hypothetical protein FIV42_08015 [Persicimonas caeni]|uniref:Uncharacterized protein n=1 Tax=Persicimonas caeni TaxID=2292766 RepID=A0A4Y6PSB4_PERCE|nr:hypothetical protein [Persicimonas caeni]QDG50675.1 hypothetical protein FIV42_08015 [Persicimonas caeni]QED31896.1 hypothetical protein FRD00_08010 [Persicimonas caeni]
MSRPRLDMSEVVDRMFDDTAVWQLVFLVAATLLASLWTLDFVRAGLFGLFDEERTGRLAAALEDPNDEIAAEACAVILTDGQGLVPSGLIRTLYLRPQVAFSCLEQATATVERRRAEKAANDETPTEDDLHNPFYRREVDLVPHHEVVASTLGQRWMTDLFEGTSNACETADNARRALEYAKLDTDYRLLTCAVAADSAEVRQCCIGQLGGKDAFVALLDRPDRVPLREASDDYRALVGASFPSVPTAKVALDRRRSAREADTPNAPVEGGEKRFGDLQFDVQDWVIDVGCRLHFFESSRQKVPASFEPLVESQSCAPTDPPWAGMYSAPSWTKTCLERYAYRRSQAYTPRESLCKSLGDATVDSAVSVTSLIVTAAVSEARVVPGVQRDELELAGDNFGARLYGFKHGRPIDENNEPESTWKGDGMVSPMGGL